MRSNSRHKFGKGKVGLLTNRFIEHMPLSAALLLQTGRFSLCRSYTSPRSRTLTRAAKQLHAVLVCRY